MRYGYYSSKNGRLLDPEAKPAGFSDEELLEQVVQLLEKYDGELPSSRVIQHHRLTEASLGMIMNRLGGGKWRPVKALAWAEYLRRHPELDEAPGQKLAERQRQAADLLCQTIVQDGGVIQTFVTYYDKYDFDGMNICKITDIIGQGSWTAAKRNVIKLLARRWPELELEDLSTSKRQKDSDGPRILHNLVVLAHKIGQIPVTSDVSMNMEIVGVGYMTAIKRILGQRDGNWSEVQELIRQEIAKVDQNSPVLTGNGAEEAKRRRNFVPNLLPV